MQGPFTARSVLVEFDGKDRVSFGGVIGDQTS